MSPARILFAACLAFGGGILAAEFEKAFLVLPALPFMPLFWKMRPMRALLVAGILLCSFSLGALRFEGAMQTWQESPLVAAANEGREVAFVGLVAEEPRSSLIVLDSGEGGVRVRTEEQFLYGDQVFFEGTLELPPSFSGFDYPMYLAKEGIFAQSSSFSLLSVSDGRASVWTRTRAALFALRAKFSQTLHTFIPEPEASVLGAILLGEKTGISQQTGDELSRAGLRHITAISGMHVAILASLLSSLLVGIGLWRRHALLLALSLVLFFVALTGFQVSAVRAGFMGSLAVLAGLFGRHYGPFRALVVAAAILLFSNPFLLLHDVGFQLSFLAVLGIGLAADPVQSFLRKVPEFLGMREILAISIAAQVFTFPILLTSFKEASSVSLLSNVFAVPVLPVVLSLGFPFLILGTFVPFLGSVFGYAEYLLIHWVLTVAAAFSWFPAFSSNSLVFLGYAVFLVFLLHFLWKRRRHPSPWGPRRFL